MPYSPTAFRFNPVFLVVLTVLMLLVVACEQPTDPGSDPDPIEITGIGWAFENIHPSYFSSSPSSSAFAAFTVLLDTDQIGDRSVSTVKVGAGNRPDDYWTLDTSDDFSFDPDRGHIDLPLLYDSDADHVNYLDWRFEVTMSDGVSDTFEVEFKAADGESAPSAQRIYSQDYTGDTSGMSPMLPRANVSRAEWDGSGLEIDFSFSDSRVANGWAWVYDSNGNYIGYTDTAFEWSATSETALTSNSTVVSSWATSSGTTSVQARVEAAGFTDESSTYDLADVGEVVILLTDGFQYTRDYYYDFRSRSAVTTVTRP